MVDQDVYLHEISHKCICGQRLKDFGQRAESREQRAESREQRAETQLRRPDARADLSNDSSLCDTQGFCGGPGQWSYRVVIVCLGYRVVIVCLAAQIATKSFLRWWLHNW